MRSQEQVGYIEFVSEDGGVWSGTVVKRNAHSFRSKVRPRVGALATSCQCEDPHTTLELGMLCLSDRIGLKLTGAIGVGDRT